MVLADVDREAAPDLLKLLRRSGCLCHCQIVLEDTLHAVKVCTRRVAIIHGTNRYKLRANVDVADASQEAAVWVNFGPRAAKQRGHVRQCLHF